ncbi:transmembrane protein 192 isoform X2 [Betta splendens]|uniref:Transmembrane protein 192 n=1 Tax=Betta splendens TaxID=158456 RepID=A0A6P7N582_BETSP|nr:transmembrane protein 192 isoform X2 [Betta splendens]
MDTNGPSHHRARTSVDMTRSMEEESLLDGPLISADALHSAIRKEFRSIPTHVHAFLLTLVHVLYVVASVCVAVLCVLKFGQEEMCSRVFGNVPGESAIVLGKVGLWLLVLVFTWFVQHHHNRARRRGYLRFYRLMCRLKDLPFTIHSAGNVLVLINLVAGLSQAVRIYLLLTILGVELLVVLSCLLFYIVKVHRFNSERAAPDVSQEDRSHSYSVTSQPTETGFREGSSLEEVVEKQADLIEYLKQHNTLLSTRLLSLTAQH